MGRAAKKRPAGPPAEPGSTRRAGTAWRTCASTLRPGAAGLEGSVAHPNTGVPIPARSGRRSPGPISADMEWRKSADADFLLGADTPYLRRHEHRTLAATGRHGGVRAGLWASRRHVPRSKQVCRAARQNARPLTGGSPPAVCAHQRSALIFGALRGVPAEGVRLDERLAVRGRLSPNTVWTDLAKLSLVYRSGCADRLPETAPPSDREAREPTTRRKRRDVRRPNHRGSRCHARRADRDGSGQCATDGCARHHPRAGRFGSSTR